MYPARLEVFVGESPKMPASCLLQVQRSSAVTRFHVDPLSELGLELSPETGRTEDGFRSADVMTVWLEAHRTLSLIAAGIATTFALAVFCHGSTTLYRGLRNPDHPDQSTWVVRGIRWGIVAIGLLFLAGGFFWATVWPFIFAAVFLGEELFETGIMLAALRDQRKEAEQADRQTIRPASKTQT